MSLRFILILLSHLRQGLPSGFFPSCLLTKFLYAFRISPVRGPKYARQNLERLNLREIYIRGYTQKFPDWLPGARTATGTTLCHYVQLHRYFVSQSSEYWRHNPSCYFSTSVRCCCLLHYDSVRKLLDTPSYISFDEDNFSKALSQKIEMEISG